MDLPVMESKPGTTSELYSSMKLPNSVFATFPSVVNMDPHIFEVRISFSVVRFSFCSPFSSYWEMFCKNFEQ